MSWKSGQQSRVCCCPDPRLLLQCIANCVTGLLKGRLNSCYVMDRIQEDKVVDHTVVTSRRYCNFGLFEFARIGLALVAKRIVFGSDNESRRQTPEAG